jgi:hypothetical protein
MPNVYTPGVCNIGPEEVKMRVRAGWLGLIATVVIGAFLFWLQSAPWTRLVLFLPAFVSAVGFIQAQMHFCVAFASKGLFNMDKAVGVTESVDKAEFRKADQKKAIQIWTYSFLIALAVGVVAYFL